MHRCVHILSTPPTPPPQTNTSHRINRQNMRLTPTVNASGHQLTTTDPQDLLTMWESHDVEDSVQLVMMVWITGFDILLTTVEDRF